MIKKDLKSGNPDIHTICLWNKASNQIAIFDPTNSTLTDYLDKPLEKLLNKEKIIITRYGPSTAKKEISSDDKFYSTSMIASPGLNDLDSRDCIDVAVKIALVLNEISSSAPYTDLQKSIASMRADKNEYKNLGKTDEIVKSLEENLDAFVLNRIKELSNQASNNNFIGSANNGTIMRGLQSSNAQMREKVLKLLKDNKGNDAKAKGPADLVIANTLSELEELEKLRMDPDSVLNKNSKALSSVSGIFLHRINEFDKLQKDINDFNRNLEKIHTTFPALKNFPNLKLEIQTRNEVKANNINIAFSRYVDNDGRSTLHKAVLNNDYKEVYTILNQFSKDDSKKFAGLTDYWGQTALHLAVNNGTSEIINKLIDVMDPQDFLWKNVHGSTALHLAVHTNNVEAVKLLIEKKIPGLVAALDIYNQTALHWAAGKGLEEISRLLLNNMTSEEVNITTINGVKAIQWAQGKLSEELMNVFKQKANASYGNESDSTYNTDIPEAISLTQSDELKSMGENANEQ